MRRWGEKKRTLARTRVLVGTGEPQSAYPVQATLGGVVQHYAITLRLAYYPPYHSKYNAIERWWGILEQHWNGSLLDSGDAVIQYTRTRTWKGNHPVVALVTTTSSIDEPA